MSSFIQILTFSMCYFVSFVFHSIIHHGLFLLSTVCQTFCRPLGCNDEKTLQCIYSFCTCENPSLTGDACIKQKNHINTYLTFYFETILDLQKSCKYDSEFSYALFSASPDSGISHNYITILKTKNSTLVECYSVQTSFST